MPSAAWPWTTLYGTGAYLLGDAMRRVEGPLGIGLAIVAAGVIAASVWFFRRNEKRLEDKAAAEMQGEAAIRS